MARRNRRSSIVFLPHPPSHPVRDAKPKHALGALDREQQAFARFDDGSAM
jgi:hypothetical protein